MIEPDWTKAKDYEYTKEFEGTNEFVCWAWEFLRRNEGYRSDSAEFQVGKITAKEYVPPKLPEETEKAWQTRCLHNEIDYVILNAETALARKWGLRSELYDPSLTAVEIMEQGSEVVFERRSSPSLIRARADLEAIPLDEPYDDVAFLQGDRIVVSFDLSKPWSPQSKIAKKWFEDRGGSKGRGGGGAQQEAFLTGVRILDAIREGASDKDIRDELFSDEAEDGYSYVNSAKKSAADNCEIRYRAIAWRKPSGLAKK